MILKCLHWAIGNYVAKKTLVSPFYLETSRIEQKFWAASILHSTDIFALLHSGILNC